MAKGQPLDKEELSRKVEQGIRTMAIRWRTFVDEADKLAAETGRDKTQALEDLLRVHVTKTTSAERVGQAVASAYIDSSERLAIMIGALRKSPMISVNKVIERLEYLRINIHTTGMKVYTEAKVAGEPPVGKAIITAPGV